MLKLLALALGLVADIVTAELPKCTGRDARNLFPPHSPCRVRECRATQQKNWKNSKKCLRAPTCEEIRQSENKNHRRYSKMCQKKNATECFQIRLGFPFALTTSKKKNNGDPDTCEGLTKWYGLCVTKESENGSKVEIGMIRRTIMKEGEKELFAVASNRAGCSGFVNIKSIEGNPYSSKCGETYIAKQLPFIEAPTQGKITMETITTADGRVRKYLLFRSKANMLSTDGGKAPLIVDIHGYSGCAEYNAIMIGWLSIAATQNMVVAWPQSLEFAGINPFNGIYHPFVSSWSVRNFPTDATIAGIDDMAFLKDMIREIQGRKELNMDPSRLYMTGHSLGSGMAQQFALEESAITAALVQFAFFMVSFPQTQEETLQFINKGILELSNISNVGVKLVSPVPVFTVHATEDETVPYNEVKCTPEELLQGCQPTPGARWNNNLWAAINECTKSNNKQFLTPAPYNITTFTECSGDEVNAVEVKLLTIEGGTHTPFTYFGQPIDATQQAWEFIKNFSKPGASSSHV
mmetsp:Transcript_47883/g.93542  ORF Transcript_47883/g.93542 Transcript_47883/m.93542 type:complete len:522 (-) Transcript_47883:151-1716(-)|eukprot:CAMPEP_0194314454 /NCGR_PEP_ID=MMETSP0171-20130528/11299_1 /TAXON_ID=218684 /ORGANISM="Corethron pennatum, Strain L29A3" /LENGTH=521 /DNA_ID=CAMNT_0039069873 /DNA_START=111 /DNA_END=1676 /DNA_ORIENTATION=-